jgi:hypothetical protein
MRHNFVFLALALPLALQTGSGQTGTQSRYVRSGDSARPAPFAAQSSSKNSLREMRVSAGTMLHVRLNNSIDTRRSRSGDTFSANLTSPVVENGVTVIPVGTRVYGRVVESLPSGRFKGRAVLALRLESVDLRGQRYTISTSALTRSTTGHKKRNLTLIGGGGGLGATIGAIAGGGAGALIGAGAGAAAGTAGAAFTGRKQLRIPVETAMSFRLSEPVSIRI